jgi:CBS domain-containing protein
MTTEVATVTPETTLREAAELLSARHISGAPVLRGNSVVGVVSATDLLRFTASTSGAPSERTDQNDWGDFTERTAADEAEREDSSSLSYFAEMWADAGADVAERMATSGSAEWDTLDAHTVDEVMTREVSRLSPHDDVLAAADLMRHRAIHRVLVMDGAKLVGIVSTSDIARAAAEHRLTTRTYLFNREPGVGVHHSRRPDHRRG